MPISPPVVYDESKITTLSSLEHIRLRPGMYIGRLGIGSQLEDGIYILIKEIIDNAVDEHIMGFGNRIQIQLSDQDVQVRDFGRGIPFGKLVECVSVINTGAKYSDDVFQFSIGLNGVGTKAVNALSSFFQAQSFRQKETCVAMFSKGILTQPSEQRPAKGPDGTLVLFRPDADIFGNYAYRHEFIEQLIWNYAYLNSQLFLEFNGKTIHADDGLAQRITDAIGEAALYDRVHYRSKQMEYAFTHTEDYNELQFSYVNGHYTSDGGTHLSAFREGFLKGVNEFFKASFQSSDVRDGFVAAFAVKLKDPIFESQTKNKLGNTDIRSWIVQEVRSSLVDYLHKNSHAAETIKNKVQLNERIRKELQNVKKLVKSRHKKSLINVPQLRDCKYHLTDTHAKRDESMIFLTEGQSAGGSMISARDALTQAIFCMRGKPLNCWNLKRDALYKNEEFYHLMQALGIEDSIDGLRYQKVVLATDADVDGMHIRNLLLTFFLHYFEELVSRQHLYILETPLFRIRNTKETRYCYSETEKEDAIRRLKKGKFLEITRFKGLGEISPKEFGPFIRDEMRTTPVHINDHQEIRTLLSFYMGKNTETRKHYIMEHLL